MKTIHQITIYTGDELFCSIRLNKCYKADVNKLKNVIKRILAIILRKTIDIDIIYSEKP